jgi:hypothetical protein
MIDRHAEHQSMIRRVEQAQKALSDHTNGRSERTGIAKALASVLDETYERMTMAWSVMHEPYFRAPKHHVFRSQKAAELSICYTIINNAYDELCYLNTIGKDERTEPTTQDLVKAQKEQERAAKAARRQRR